MALKFEVRIKNDRGHLSYENQVYRVLDGVHGIPKVYWYGEEYESNIMIMDLLGPTLEALFNYCQRNFSLPTVAFVGKQLVRFGIS